MNRSNRYRMASWWITWRDLDWPSPDNLDRIRRRADQMAAASVDTATVFGAHFRWDFMPIWPVLHDYLAAVAEELHQRGIRLFDHHSAVLVHRYETREEMRNVKLHSGPHLPFSPTRSAAASWEFRGRRLNDWRMIDAQTGGILYLPQYTAEEFCYSNPEFVECYLEYAKMLVKETGIDGLMCDDAIHFMGFRSCACACCRARLKERTGVELPPPDDASFWGNWENPAWNAWIDLRFDANGSFLEQVRAALPPDFPLMSCCSGSSGAFVAASGQDVREFNRGCNLVHLELCGNTPPWKHDPATLNPSVASRMVSSLHHLGAAGERGYPCVGQGYGFTEPSANIIWALNTTIGASSWFSTLKGRLGLPDSILDTLPNDAEPVTTAYRFEKEHPELFGGTPVAQLAVFFPYETRNHTGYGLLNHGCTRDFRETLELLFRNGITPGVVTAIPENREKHALLLLPSAARLTADEAARLKAYAANGGKVFATGPCGLKPGPIPMRVENFWEDAWRDQPVPPQPEAPGWQELLPGITWNPARLQDGGSLGDELLDRVQKHVRELPFKLLRAKGFLAVAHETEEGGCLLHLLAAEYDTKIDEELDRRRYHRSRVNLITGADPAETDGVIHLSSELAVEAFAPLSPTQAAMERDGSVVTVQLPEKCPYTILKLTRKER